SLRVEEPRRHKKFAYPRNSRGQQFDLAIQNFVGFAASESQFTRPVCIQVHFYDFEKEPRVLKLVAVSGVVSAGGFADTVRGLSENPQRRTQDKQGEKDKTIHAAHIHQYSTPSKRRY